MARNSLREDFSRWGSLPPEEDFSLQLLGPHGNYGWVAKSGVSGQGFYWKRYSIFGLSRGRAALIGELPGGEDNGGGTVSCDLAERLDEPYADHSFYNVVELFSLDDVGQAYDIALTDPESIGSTFGRHTNDLVTSFYSWSPSDFMVESGWGGRLRRAGQLDARGGCGPKPLGP